MSVDEDNDDKEVLNVLFETFIGRRSSFSDQSGDILVIGSPEDTEIYKTVLEILHSKGLKVWPNPINFQEGFDTVNLARAVNRCKCLLPIMSRASIKWKAIEDCISLAYLTSKRIFPIGYNRCGQLRPDMNPGMKMIILTINWILIDNADTRTEVLIHLTKTLQDTLDSMAAENIQPTAIEHISSHYGHPGVDIQQRLLCGYSEDASEEQITKLGNYQMGFWRRHFDERDSVPWEEFKEAFLADYEKRLGEELGYKKDWFINKILEKEILQIKENADGELIVDRENYSSFVGNQDNSNNIYHYALEYVTGKMAMKNVFGMKSDVRLEIIKNIGRFSTPYVIGRLMTMLSDDDPDIRAVSAIALGNGTHAPNIYVLVTSALRDLLHDKKRVQDRLVKESVILALGKLKFQEVVPVLGHLWRNDPIKDVRAAAEVALRKIGGSEVEDIFRLTDVLNKEVEYLRQSRYGVL